MNYKDLSETEKRQFARNLVQRRASFETWTHHRELAEAKKILLVADRPGPKAPQTDNFHHTPFYANIHSGGWLNSLLLKADISETSLFWTNSATWDGKPGDTDILKVRGGHGWTTIIALGGNAEKFLMKNGVIVFHKFDHPQFHKRWKSKEPYPLIEFLGRIVHAVQIFDGSE